MRPNPGRVGQRRSIVEHHIVAPSTPPLSNSSRLTHVGVERRPESCRTEDRAYSSRRLCNIASSSRAALPSQAHRTQSIAGANGISDNTLRYLLFDKLVVHHE